MCGINSQDNKDCILHTNVEDYKNNFNIKKIFACKEIKFIPNVNSLKIIYLEDIDICNLSFPNSVLELTLSNCLSNNPLDIPSLERLTLSNSSVSLCSLPNLKALYLGEDETNENLPSFPALETLFINYCNVKSFPSYPKLNILSCIDLHLKSFPELPSLKEMKLNFCHNIQKIKEFKKLRFLSVTDCHRLTEVSNLELLHTFEALECDKLSQIDLVNLRDLKCSSCPKFISLPEIKTLENVTLENLNIQEINENNMLNNFVCINCPKLEIVKYYGYMFTFRNCNKLRFDLLRNIKILKLIEINANLLLFADTLIQLYIKDCNNLEKLGFNKCKLLSCINLPELKKVVSKNKLPKNENFRIVNCPKL